MDITFANRVSSGIFKQCSARLIEQHQYTDTPIELRKRIEDCFDTYLDQHALVLKGAAKLRAPTL